MRMKTAALFYPLILWGLAVGAVTAPAQGPPAMPVVVTPVVERDVPPALRLVGTVRPYKSSVIASEVDGVIAAYEAEEGQYLQPADLICRVNNTVATLKLEEAQAQLLSLKARFEELENGVRPEEMARLEALVAEAEAERAKWEYERTRVLDLLKRGQGSDKEKHDTEMDYRAAVSRLAQAKAQLDQARTGERAEVLAQARLAVAAQEAVLKRAARDVNRTEIRAPFPGALVAKRCEVGEWIEEGGAVCELVAMDRVKVRVDVPERAIVFAQAGEPATLEFEALGRTQSAMIARVIPQAAPAARTFPVEIDMPNQDHSLLPGMFVWAYVPSGPRGQRLMVTKDAIVSHGTNKTIHVVRANPDGGHMAMPMQVVTGLEFGDEIAVQAPGLKAGDLVVSRANERLFGPTPVVPEPMVATSRPDGVAETGVSAGAKMR